MTTYIIHYPDNSSHSGTRINKVITCNCLVTCNSELLKIATHDNLHNIKVIEVNVTDSRVYIFEEDGSKLTSGEKGIETPEISKKLYPEEKKYLMLYDDSCQSYNYDELKNMILQLHDIPTTWKIITQPDCTVYTYDSQANLFKASNGSTLSEELTKHFSANYKLVMHFCEDLNNPAKTFTKEMCSEQLISQNISVKHVQTYLLHLSNSKKLVYVPEQFKNIYLIDILCNDKKVGELNEIGLYYNNHIVMNSIGEPYESFKVIMKHVRKTIAKNIEHDPKPFLMHKLNEWKVKIEQCNDKVTIINYMSSLNITF